MTDSPKMQEVIQELAKRYQLDLTDPNAFLRLDLPEHDTLVIDHVAVSQIAVSHCFEECGGWKIDREVVFFLSDGQWIPIEITQMATGWLAFAKVDRQGQRLIRINSCGQEALAQFCDRWASKLEQEKWLELGIPYVSWLPPSR